MELTINEPEDEYGAAPVQCTGVLPDGRTFYFRSRHSGIQLHVPHDSVQAALALRVAGTLPDAHIVSTIGYEHVRPLILFMYDVLIHHERYHAREPYGWPTETDR